MSEERQKAAQAEVQKLLDAGVIREVQYPEWLANVVMVPKKNGKWRMCIDFTILNKACPKDEYPLPRIDTLVDAQYVGLFLRLSPDIHEQGRRRKDQFHHPLRDILLRENAGGPSQCRMHFQQNDQKSIRGSIGEKHLRIRG